MPDREILFRGRRLNSGEWVEGFYLSDDDLLPGAYICPRLTTTCKENGEMLMGGFITVDSSTVSQYTGQVDYETETMIFRGDILETQSGPSKKFVVDFDDGGYFVREIGGEEICLSLTIENIAWSMLKKIGNRWDNLELMGVKQHE